MGVITVRKNNEDILNQLELVLYSFEGRSLSWEEYDEVNSKLKIIKYLLDSSVAMNRTRSNE